MTPMDVNDTIRKLDRRLDSVEQILPTLATKTDLERFATKADLERFATKDDLERFATKDDLERFATKADLDGFATKDNLREAVEAMTRHTDVRVAEVRDEMMRHTDARVAEARDDMKRHTDVRVEDVRDDIRKVAEGVAALAASVQANSRVLDRVVQRLERHDTILHTLLERRA